MTLARSQAGALAVTGARISFVEIGENFRLCDPAHTTNASVGVILSSRDSCDELSIAATLAATAGTAETNKITKFHNRG
jgi:hypothetical protein